MIERAGADLSLSEQADLLSISRSSLYYVPRPPGDREITIKHRIDRLFTDDPCLGARRLAFLLEKEGQIKKEADLSPATRQRRTVV